MQMSLDWRERNVKERCLSNSSFKFNRKNVEGRASRFLSKIFNAQRFFNSHLSKFIVKFIENIEIAIEL